MPKPFLNKLIVHGAIGFFCVLFGCIYGFVTDDQIFLLMSLCIGVGTAIRIVSLLHTIKMHDYTELTGTCTKREVSPLTKKQKIIFRPGPGAHGAGGGWAGTHQRPGRAHRKRQQHGVGHCGPAGKAGAGQTAAQRDGPAGDLCLRYGEVQRPAGQGGH